MYIMRITVARWGNSLGIRVPKVIAEALRLSEGSGVEIEQIDGAFVVRPSGRAPIARYNVADLVAAMGPADLEPRELDWGSSRGSEVW